jgi:hypothetical protein
MKLRPRHAEPLHRSLSRRVNDWLDQKINRPLTPNTIRIRSTQDIKALSPVMISPIKGTGVSWELSAGAVSPEVMRVMFGSPITFTEGTTHVRMTGTPLKPIPIKRGRPFDWKLDDEDVMA